MSAITISAADLRYITEVTERLPNMDAIQTDIINEAGVDGDGGEAPFRFTFDVDGHNVTLEWDSTIGGWGAASIERKPG